MTPEAQEKYQKWLAHHQFTPTELDNFGRCPVKFFSESVLKVRTEPEPEVELTAAELGKIIHRILEVFMKRSGPLLYQHGLTTSIQEQLEQDARQVFAREAAHRSNASKPLLMRQQGQVLRSLQSFLEQEAGNFELRPRHFEWSFGRGTHPLQLRLPDGSSLQIAGRIDRIDVDERKKRFLVIDYKTGSTHISGKQILRGESFQIPLYILAVQQLLLPDYEPIGGLYYHFSDMSKKDGLIHAERVPDSLTFHPRSSSVVPGAKWDDSFQAILQSLTECVQKIRRGSFQPNAQPCHISCPLRFYCHPGMS